MTDTVLQVAEALAEGRHRQAEAFQQQAEKGAQQQRDQMPRYLAAEARPGDQQGQAGDTDQRVAELQAGQRAQQHAELLQVMLRVGVQAQPEEILHLQGGDDDADAGGETQCHRIGHELDQPPGAQQAESDQDQSGEQRAEQQAADAVLLGDRQQDHHEGGGRPGDVEARAAEQGNQRRTDQYRVEPVLRWHADGDGERHGQGNGDHPDGQPGGDVAAQGAPGITGAAGLAPGGEQRREGNRHGGSRVDARRV